MYCKNIKHFLSVNYVNIVSCFSIILTVCNLQPIINLKLIGYLKPLPRCKFVEQSRNYKSKLKIYFSRCLADAISGYKDLNITTTLNTCAYPIGHVNLLQINRALPVKTRFPPPLISTCNSQKEK